MVNRKQTDMAAGILIGSILLLGVLSAIQFQQTGGPMRSEMDTVPLMAVVGPLLMSLVVASIVGGVYMFVRKQMFADPGDTTTADGANETESATGAGETTEAVTGGTDETPNPAIEREILDVLPDDERRILEPVIESPGLTQTKVRDRSGFSRSKVSQTITGLEERGLLYRESQGRTYRVYPAEDIDERI